MYEVMMMMMMTMMTMLFYLCSENWTQKKITSRIDVPEKLDLSSFKGKEYNNDGGGDDHDDDDE